MNKEAESLPLRETYPKPTVFRLFNPPIYDYEIFTPSGTPYPKSAPLLRRHSNRNYTPYRYLIHSYPACVKWAISLYRIYFTNRAGIAPVVEDPVYAPLNQIYNGEPLMQFTPPNKNIGCL